MYKNCQSAAGVEPTTYQTAGTEADNFIKTSASTETAIAAYKLALHWPFFIDYLY